MPSQPTPQSEVLPSPALPTSSQDAHRFLFKPHDFSNITNPDAGKVSWLIEGIIPKNDAILWAATWKTAKTLCAYRLALDALLGRPIWGRFQTERPLRVAIFQLEMPSAEDDRRFRRLALGVGQDPATIQELVRSGQFHHFNRPRVDLTDPVDIKLFHACIRSIKPDLVILDSVIAAFCAKELNDNSVVRQLIAAVIYPLIDDGVTVLLLHHFRKILGLERHPDKKSSVLGAQAFGAATSRTYSLERLTGGEPAKKAFTVDLSMLGGWTPDDGESTILRVEDTEDDTGTTVEAVDMSKEPKKAKLTSAMKAALDVKQLVLMRGRIARKDAVVLIGAEKGYSQRVVEEGVGYAALRSWIVITDATDKKNNAKDLVPFVYEDEAEVE